MELPGRRWLADPQCLAIDRGFVLFFRLEEDLQLGVFKGSLQVFSPPYIRAFAFLSLRE
jgi:hypothetical protein